MRRFDWFCLLLAFLALLAATWAFGTRNRTSAELYLVVDETQAKVLAEHAPALLHPIDWEPPK